MRPGYEHLLAAIASVGDFSEEMKALPSSLAICVDLTIV